MGTRKKVWQVVGRGVLATFDSDVGRWGALRQFCRLFGITDLGWWTAVSSEEPTAALALVDPVTGGNEFMVKEVLV